ncbi:MAG: hypothetical protein K0Q79_2698 [Flavipsychrobacter sp.]|jgi:hypothetical protein|nr:hypothetical protein [Flavipsychrobacter sp.]
MFKKQLMLAALLLLSIASNAQKKNPFYYELISNDSKTINFVFGFYPTTYNYVEGKDVDPYTNVKAAIINNAKNSLDWNNYKIMILLKNGKLIRSYTTVAKDGDYACEYNVKGSETHYQYFCFHHKFTNEDMDKVWLVMGDDQIFNLAYDKNE